MSTKSFTPGVTARRRTAALVAVVALALAPAVAEAKTIKGTNGNNKLTGTSKSDSISGAGGNDSITAKGGNDTVSGGSGNDTISGGSGKDELQGNLGDDVISGGSGDDKIVASAPKKGPQSPDDDKAVGGAGNDQLSTGPGDDRLVGGQGDDDLNADTGADRLDAGAGDDLLNGGDGNDDLDGGEGGDWLLGADGDDTVDGGPGNDHPQGGPGDDRVYGGGGRDELDGDEGDDFIDGGAGDASCADVAGPKDDNDCDLKMHGAAGTKHPGTIRPNITADEGDDVVYPGGGVDVVFGEQGFDTIVVTDDGSYDRLFCADRESEPTLPPLAQRGRVIYVATSSPKIDPLDDLRNCDYDPEHPNAPGDQVFTMSAREFLADDSLVYPDHPSQHLPLPDGVSPDRSATPASSHQRSARSARSAR